MRCKHVPPRQRYESTINLDDIIAAERLTVTLSAKTRDMLVLSRPDSSTTVRQHMRHGDAYRPLSQSVQSGRIKITDLFMAALWNRAGHYIFAL